MDEICWKNAFLIYIEFFFFKFIVGTIFWAHVITNARFIQSNNKINILIDNKPD